MPSGQNESDDLPQGNPDWLEHNAGGEVGLESDVIKLPDSGWLRLVTDSECIPLFSFLKMYVYIFLNVEMELYTCLVEKKGNLVFCKAVMVRFLYIPDIIVLISRKAKLPGWKY